MPEEQLIKFLDRKHASTSGCVCFTRPNQRPRQIHQQSEYVRQVIGKNALATIVLPLTNTQVQVECEIKCVNSQNEKTKKNCIASNSVVQLILLMCVVNRRLFIRRMSVLFV